MRLVPLLLVLAGPALAWDPSHPQVTADLDGDGRTETYVLLPGEAEGTVDLVVDDGTGWATARGVAWQGAAAGQEATLSVSEAGSVVVESGNDAIGRDRWRIWLTVAHRDGDLRVAGITYEWRDTLDLAVWGLCDINLLTGRGEVETEAGTRAFRVTRPAPALWDWRDAGAADWIEPCIG